jgi:hypothetical protein
MEPAASADPGPGGRRSRRRVGMSDEARRALVAAVLRRSDTAFADRVRQIAEEDRELLDRLAR